jgi:peptidyl-prolyl cis-trans isomerase SurA
MQTAPDGYAVPAVNQAIASLPIGKVSGVLEGPTSLHIVRVENRRAAGPATYDEVRQKIYPMLLEEKSRVERAAFLAKLRKRSLISISDDGIPARTPSPSTVPTNSPKS